MNLNMKVKLMTSYEQEQFDTAKIVVFINFRPDSNLSGLSQGNKSFKTILAKSLT